MDYLSNSARAALIQQISRVGSLAEVHAAQTALRAWRQQHPEDWGILDSGEELSLLEDAYLEEASPGYQRPVRSEWQQLETHIIDARTVPAIIAARYDLRQWEEQHPAEIQAEYLEALFVLLDVVEEQSGGVVPVAQSERELAGQLS